MTEDILESLKRELINGHVKRGHPFRYFTLGTSKSNAPQLRTVVLRKVKSDFVILVYTDLRSQKIAEIKENNAVSALFYHPKKLIQIKIEGSAEIITDKDELKPFWGNISDKSKKDYTTNLAPGCIIKSPNKVDYTNEVNHFCMLKIKPTYIEYLKLTRPNHIRIGYSKVDGEFKGEFLVP
ncbi:MAG: pyridoxamine 5'-phosphate oxidase family protein [Flavobacteriales bacterium]